MAASGSLYESIFLHGSWSDKLQSDYLILWIANKFRKSEVFRTFELLNIIKKYDVISIELSCIAFKVGEQSCLKNSVKYLESRNGPT